MKPKKPEGRAEKSGKSSPKAASAKKPAKATAGGKDKDGKGSGSVPKVPLKT